MHESLLFSLTQNIRYFLLRNFKITIEPVKAMKTNKSQLCLLLKSNIDTVFDVGANTGQFGMMLRQIGYKGTIHSFEPVSDTFERLVKTAASDSSWHCHNMALGESNGEISINVPERSTDFASILKPNQAGIDAFKWMKADRTETVALRRLDDFVIEGNVPGKSWFLKMDTQGFDLQVFSGASGIREKIRYAMTELSIEPIYEGMPSHVEALAVFRESGFRPVGFFPVSRNPDLSLIEMDCILVNAGRR